MYFTCHITLPSTMDLLLYETILFGTKALNGDFHQPAETTFHSLTSQAMKVLGIALLYLDFPL